MARLVLDTNSLVQCISRQSRYHELWLSFLDGRNQLCVTTEILEEYAEIIERLTNHRFSELALDVITNNPNTLFVSIFYNFELIKSDPDDNKFVDCAFAANATYIVSNDKHFDVLKSIQFPSIDVIKIDEFLEELKSM